MDEQQKENIALICGLALCLIVFSFSFYQTYVSMIEKTVEFKVFEVNCWDKFNTVETQVLTYGEGKFYFLGNWTGQFVEGGSYNVTYVQKQGSTQRDYRDLIVLSWEEI